MIWVFSPYFWKHPYTLKQRSFFLFNGTPPPLLIAAGASGQSLFNTLMQAPRSVNFHTIDFIWEPLGWNRGTPDLREKFIQIGGVFFVGSWGFLWNL